MTKPGIGKMLLPVAARQAHREDPRRPGMSGESPAPGRTAHAWLSGPAYQGGFISSYNELRPPAAG